MFYALNIIMHRGAQAHWCPTAVIERQGMGRGGYMVQPAQWAFPKGPRLNSMCVYDTCTATVPKSYVQRCDPL